MNPLQEIERETGGEERIGRRAALNYSDRLPAPALRFDHSMTSDGWIEPTQ
jgi:hypothetical protein